MKKALAENGARGDVSQLIYETHKERYKHLMRKITGQNLSYVWMQKFFKKILAN